MLLKEDEIVFSFANGSIVIVNIIVPLTIMLVWLINGLFILIIQLFSRSGLAATVCADVLVYNIVFCSIALCTAFYLPSRLNATNDLVSSLTNGITGCCIGLAFCLVSGYIYSSQIKQRITNFETKSTREDLTANEQQQLDVWSFARLLCLSALAWTSVSLSAIASIIGSQLRLDELASYAYVYSLVIGVLIFVFIPTACLCGKVEPEHSLLKNHRYTSLPTKVTHSHKYVNLYPPPKPANGPPATPPLPMSPQPVFIPVPVPMQQQLPYGGPPVMPPIQLSPYPPTQLPYSYNASPYPPNLPLRQNYAANYYWKDRQRTSQIGNVQSQMQRTPSKNTNEKKNFSIKISFHRNA